MLRRPSALPLALAVALAAAGVAEAQIAQHGIRESPVGVHLFTDARIVVSPERTIERGSLLVEDGRVVAVGESVAEPPGAIVHDLDGATILPGFVDPYTDYGLGHLPEPERRRGGPPQYEADRVGATAANDAVHAERDWVEELRPDAEAAERHLARGVTTVQSARLDGVFRGRAFVATLGEGTAGEVVLRPASRHFLSFDKGTSRQLYPSSLMGSIALLRQTLLDAEWYAAASDPARRTLDGRRPDVDRALAALADLEGPVVFATDDVQSLLRAARVVGEAGLDAVYVGANDEHELLAEVAALGQPLVLPLSFPKLPEVKTAADELDVELADLRRWERGPSNPAALAEAGVAFAFTGHGLRDDEDFFTNLRLAVARGLSPEAALAALTTVPARLAGVEGETGTLEPGKLASFVVADGDLFTDREAKVAAVWVRGELAHEATPEDERDFRGTYTVRIGEREVVVRIAGERERLRGELVEGERTERLRDVRSSLDSLSFSAPIGAPDEEGLARFSVSEVRGEVRGQVTLPDGMPLAIMMDPKVPDPEAEPDEAAAEETAAEAADAEDRRRAEAEAAAAVLASRDLVSRTTRPNVAYGFAEPPEREDVLVRGATVWTLEGEGRLEDADLLVRDGRIAAVGAGLDAPAGVRVIDGAGLHVTPGIIDEHSHLAIAGGVNEGSNAVTAEVRIGDVVDATDVGIYRALAGGVTAAQLLHGSANPIGGQAQVIKLRWGRTAEELKFDAAPPTIKFALGENVKQSNWGEDFTVRYPQTRMGVETILRDRFLAARDLAAEHERWRALPERERRATAPPRRDLQLETLAEILAGERRVHCHSYVQSEILMLMRLAEELGFTVDTFTHILEGYKVAPEMAAHGAAASSFADWWAYKFEVYDAIPYNTCLLSKHGVVTSINSDSDEMIRRLNQEAGKSVLYCDMDEVEALKLATLNPARQLHVDDRVGSLAPGKDADFVVWNGHPLSVYSRPLSTWIEGVPYFTEERDAELRREVHAERQALVQKALRAAAASERGGAGGRGGGKPPGGWRCEDVVDVWNLDSAHEEAR